MINPLHTTQTENNHTDDVNNTINIATSTLHKDDVNNANNINLLVVVPTAHQHNFNKPFYGFTEREVMTQ